MNFPRIRFFEIIHDVFMEVLCMTSFTRYDLILLRYSSTDRVLFLSPLLSYSIIIIPKIAYSYWFIIIFFLMLKRFLISLITLFLIALFSFFSLKRILISLAVPFASFFQSKQISYIFDCSAIYFFFSLKRFLTSLIMLTSIFCLFQDLIF